ncbi:MAG: DUF5652 family protein [Candidatus Bathyarchaeia archaeon]
MRETYYKKHLKREFASFKVKSMPDLYAISPPIALLLVSLAIWSFFWKIPGLWFTARRGEKVWFIVIFFVNLAGILEIYYLHSRKCWPFKGS